MGRILIVDDEPSMRKILASNLLQDRHEIFEEGGVEGAKRRIASQTFDAVITDQKMPDGEGMEVLAAAREADATLSVVFLTAVATLEMAVESMRNGAFDFLAKPFVPGVVRATVLRACEHSALLRENSVLKEKVSRLEGSSEICGNSAATAAVRALIGKVAPASATVLITGETGTGKELVARAIHRQSPRSQKAFVAVNCASLPETLLESELFGHERGAFTGADRSRAGLFEAADGGTLFLDEIGEMPLVAQAKLLRVLTDGQIVRLGSTKPRSVNVRVLAATHRNLPACVREGSFREDLFYRLNVVPIHIPPLRERPEDIPVLCSLLLGKVARQLDTPVRRLSAEAAQRLARYPFPGNVRELANLIERACILCQGDLIDSSYFPLTLTRPEATGLSGSKPDEPLQDTLPSEEIDLRGYLADVEKRMIENALREANGVQAEAGRRLGLTRSDISYKVSKYSIKVESSTG